MRRLRRLSSDGRSSAGSIDVAFAVIAMREVEFFAEVADHLSRSGLRVAFISFYQPGNQYLIRKGYEVFDLYKEIPGSREGELSSSIQRCEERYGFDFQRLILHEQLTFGRDDQAALGWKLVSYLEAFERFLSARRPSLVIQELGGFIAPMALYHAARRSQVDHLFIEPAMFKKRVFLTRNAVDFDLREPSAFSEETRQAVDAYMADYDRHKLVAMPKKDRHHFRDATIRKFVNSTNAAKLLKKVWFKYGARRRQEYDAIGTHVRRSWKMYRNRRQIASLYSPISVIAGTRYVYYPFHVPLDFQLTVRCREYLDQLSVVDRIARSLPDGVSLVVKEHPAAIGAYSREELKEIMRHDNVFLLDPTLNSYDVVAGSEAVVTINSKVGAESLLQGKHVFVLGPTFYRGKGLTRDVSDLSEMGKELSSFLSGESEPERIPHRQVEDFLCTVFQNSHPGELYDHEPENLLNFTKSIHSVVEGVAVLSDSLQS